MRPASIAFWALTSLVLAIIFIDLVILAIFLIDFKRSCTKRKIKANHRRWNVSILSLRVAMVRGDWKEVNPL